MASTLAYLTTSNAPDGALDLATAGTVALAGLDSYHQALPLKRMAYAKPDLAPRVVAPRVAAAG